MIAEFNLIRRLVAVFGEPKTDDPEIYLAEFEKSLKGWSAEVLQQAGDRVIKESVFWPKPAEVIAICRSIAVDIASRSRRPERQPIYENPASQEERDRVAEIVRLTIMGLKAKAPPEPELRDEVAPNRAEYEAMQRNSPNRFHRRH